MMLPEEPIFPRLQRLHRLYVVVQLSCNTYNIDIIIYVKESLQMSHKRLSPEDWPEILRKHFEKRTAITSALSISLHTALLKDGIPITAKYA